MNVIVYHDGCSDGFAAAYVAWTYLSQMNMECRLVPAVHNAPLKLNFTGHDVYFVDFCPKREELISINNVANKVVVLDHHKTTLDLCGDLDFVKLDMNKSGAGMAWSYFFPQKELPKALAAIQDCDLWKFDLKDTKEFMAFFATIDTSYSNIQNAFNDFKNLLTDDAFAVSIKLGTAIKLSTDAVIQKLGKRSSKRKLFGKDCLVLNSITMQSSIGNYMCEVMRAEVGCVWYFDHESKSFRVSLRSLQGTDNDVEEIARAFGGGGHKHAAGLQFNGSSIEELFD